MTREFDGLTRQQRAALRRDRAEVAIWVFLGVLAGATLAGLYFITLI